MTCHSGQPCMHALSSSGVCQETHRQLQHHVILPTPAHALRLRAAWHLKSAEHLHKLHTSAACSSSRTGRLHRCMHYSRWPIF